MVSSGMLRRAALVRIDVSEELSASFVTVTRIGELGTTLAATSNRRTLHCLYPRYAPNFTVYGPNDSLVIAIKLKIQKNVRTRTMF
jgi:hypothetical protein